MCRMAKSADLDPVKIELMHGPLSCKQKYADFFNCDIEFNAAESRLFFNLEDTKAILPASNSDLTKINERALIDTIDKLHENDLSGKVAKVVSEHLTSGGLNDKKVAESLFMSSRTLNRKLASEGVTYKQILENVRQSLAREYISNDNISLIEISYLLGFSDQSAFTRAYKRWTGVAPGKARKNRLEP